MGWRRVVGAICVLVVQSRARCQQNKTSRGGSEGHRLNQQQLRGVTDVPILERSRQWQDTSTSMGEKLRQAVLSGSQDDLKHLSSVSACGRRWFEMLQVFAVYHADIFGLFRCTRCCTRCTSYSLIVAKLMLIGFTV